LLWPHTKTLENKKSQIVYICPG